MIAQFEVAGDGSVWQVDVENLTWKMVTDDPATAPSGDLVWQNVPFTYTMAGRRADTEGPGRGLCSFLLATLPVGQTLKILIRPNVEIKNFTCPLPIKEIRYEILPFSK